MKIKTWQNINRHWDLFEETIDVRFIVIVSNPSTQLIILLITYLTVPEICLILNTRIILNQVKRYIITFTG